MESVLDVQHIKCRYGDKVIIEDLSFSLAPGRIVCLLGPSGCGKTTALRAIAGFEPVYAGAIRLEGELLSDAATVLPPERRRIGMVFQDYALFPHLKVRDNVAFGLHDRPREARDEAVARLLALVKLEEYADVFPHQLSGGQQQRVALARALAPEPKLLLLDEPFSSLDTELRRSLSVEVRDILKRRGISAILVTHDQTEAFNVADEIGVMAAGALRQWGPPQELFHRPADRFVAGFICNGRFIPGTALPGGRAATAFGEVELEDPAPAEGAALSILLRPWQVLAASEGLSAEIVQQQFLGATSATTLRLDGGALVETNDESLAARPVGERVRLALAPVSLRAFPAP